MKRIIPFLLLAAAACAHALGAGSNSPEPTVLWTEAHQALAAGNFGDAQGVFRRLSAEFPAEPEGREALFYLGTIRLDPRNPAWDPAPAAERLRQYLALDSTNAPIHRAPEATTLLQLAEQLNLPPAERVAGLAPGTPDTLPEQAPQGTIQTAILIARAAELDSLRRELSARDEQIRRQKEELERIRRTLIPRSPGPVRK